MGRTSMLDVINSQHYYVLVLDGIPAHSCKLIVVAQRCNRAAASAGNPDFGPKIDVNGLLSVCNMNLRP